MTAAFLLYLVLQMNGGGAGLVHVADGTGDVEGAAPTGVDVDQHRQIGDVGDAAQIGEHIFHSCDTEIGNTAGAGSHTAAGDVEGAVAGGLGEAGVIGVDGAHALQRLLLLDGGAETGAGGLGIGHFISSKR